MSSLGVNTGNFNETGNPETGNPTELTVAQAARAIAAGRLKAAELAEACLDRIETLDDRLLAWVYVDRSAVTGRGPRRRCRRVRRAGPWGLCTVCPSG